MKVKVRTSVRCCVLSCKGYTKGAAYICLDVDSRLDGEALILPESYVLRNVIPGLLGAALSIFSLSRTKGLRRMLNVKGNV